METIWVGADWDSEKCVVEAELGQKLWKQTVSRHPSAVAELVDKLGPGRLVLGIEAGDPLWERLWEEAGAEVFIFNPMKAKQYAKSLNSSGAGDDKRSASTLRKQLKSEEHRKASNCPLPQELRGLNQVVSARETLGGEVSRWSNRLNDLLRQVHPALRPKLGGLDSNWALNLVRSIPTPTTWLELSDKERQGVLKRVPVRRRAEVVDAIGERWCCHDAAEERAARFRVRECAEFLALATQQKKLADKEIDAITMDNSENSLVRSVRGLGTVLSAGANLALAGSKRDRDRFGRQTGSAPVTIKSGVRGDANPPVFMRRTVNATMRRIGYLIAVQLVAHHGWAKAQFAYHRSKGIEAPGAFRRISRSFGRILSAMIKNQTEFDEELYIASLKRKGVVWAQAL